MSNRSDDRKINNSAEALLSEKIQIERKVFFFDLKENPRGRFLRITEEVGGRRDAIIIPTSGLDAFKDTLERAIAANVNTSAGVAPLE